MDDLNTNQSSFEESMQGMFSGMEAKADAHVWQNIELALQSTTDRSLAWWWWSGAASIILIFMIGSSVFDVGYTYDPRLVSDGRYEKVYLEECDEFDDSGTKVQFEYANREIKTNDLGIASVATQSSANHSERLDDNYSSQEQLNGAIKMVGGVDAIHNSYKTRQSLHFLKIAKIESDWDTAMLVSREEETIKVNNDSDVDWQEWDNEKVSEWGLAANLGSSNSKQQTSGGFGFQSDGLSTQENTVAMGFGDQRSIQELTYLSPFVIGVRGNWKFAKRFSLESGISYSLLPTNGESFSAGLKRVNRYVDHFIGLPILLNISIIDKKRFGLYSSQGFLVEKGIVSRSTLTTYLGSEEQSKQINKLNAQGFQIGASLGLGAEYRINKNWGFFLEPRITSWLVNLNVQENIRNQQALWPTLDLGIRLNLR